LKRTLLLTSAFIFLLLNAHSQEFTRIEESAGIDQQHIDEFIMGGGAAFFDYDNDGYLDIYVTGGSSRDKLYHNNQDETFTEVGLEAGFLITQTTKTNGVCTGDIDNDGDRDVFVSTGVGEANLLFENLGDGTFSNISNAAGIIESTWSTSVSMGDYNMDGYLDIYVGNYVEIFNFPGVPFYQQIDQTIANYFYINNGDNTFTEQGETLLAANNGATLAVSMTDYDWDNDIDIYIANDFGGIHPENAMLKNQYPINSFTNSAFNIGMDAAMNGMGIAVGDFDNNMQLDYYVSNMANNIMYQNEGDYTYTDVAGMVNTLCATLVSWGNFFFDYNHDGNLDLFVANGGVLMQQINRNQANSLFTANDIHLFTESLDYTGQIDSAVSRGAIYGDIDNDGDLDIFVVNMSDNPDAVFNCYLLRNDLESEFNWLKIKTEGTTNNFDGFGTKAIVYSNGQNYLREVDGGSSYESQNSTILHFGLGENHIIDSIAVIWLGGETQMIYDVPANQMLHIKEGNAYNFSINTICEGDSIFFNNEWISEIGTYYDTTAISLENDSITAISIMTTSAFYSEVEITINNGDSILIDGVYQSTAGSYDEVYESSAGCDSIVTTILSIDFSSSINEIEEVNYSIYPNPSNGNFTLVLSDPTYIISVEVYSIIGTQISHELINETREKIKFDLSDQTNGIYFLHIHTNGKDEIKKVILNK
jgi:hypothetical protein